jgi:hypothetical protein
MNLPPEANIALINFLGAVREYTMISGAAATCKIEPPHRAFDELEAVVRDAEQALIVIFSAVLGEPDVTP